MANVGYNHPVSLNAKPPVKAARSCALALGVSRTQINVYWNIYSLTHLAVLCKFNLPFLRLRFCKLARLAMFPANRKEHAVSKKTFIQRFGRKLAERDGWVCHYCERELRPLDTFPQDPKYYHISGHELADDGKTWKPFWGLKHEIGSPTVDHITLQKDGGTDDLDNLVLACWECNTERNVKPYADFLALAKSRPKGYPRCARCGKWHSRVQSGGNWLCGKCV